MVILKKRLNYKHKVKFKIHDIKTWLTITIHILPNISQSKDKLRIIFGQLIKYNKSYTFLQKSCRKWGRETSSAPLFAFWNSFIWGKSKRSAAQYILIDLNLAYETIKQYSMKNNPKNKETLCDFKLLILRYTGFWFFQKRSGNSFFTAFCVWFIKKNVSHVSFLLTDQIS